MSHKNPSSTGGEASAKSPKHEPHVETSRINGELNPVSGGEDGEKKPSNKELKLRQKAEKQAKRAAQKAAQDQNEQAGSQPHLQSSWDSEKSSGHGKPSDSGKPQAGRGPKTIDMTSHHKRTGSNVGKELTVRSATAAAAITTSHANETETIVATKKKLGMFSHLYNKERRTSIAGVGREIHPAVLALGVKLRDYDICGGNARCVATLLAFKKVIQSYSTPPSMALPRHLTTHLSHQISYLSSSRSLSTSQGNSIRWLKKLIVELDPEVSDPDARNFLCKSIDQFILEKVTYADDMIVKEASERVVDGDVVLVYAKSSVVEKTLIAAHRQLGRRFTVVVADSRPLFEGRNLARELTRAGLHVQYCLLTGLASLSKKVTKCFLGASAMTENGRLYSRIGTAMVAMMAKNVTSFSPDQSQRTSHPLSHKNAAGTIPVFALCESVKFSDRVLLDSIVYNELGDPGALIETQQDHDDNHKILSLPSSSSLLTSSSAPTSASTTSINATKKSSSGGGSKSNEKGTQIFTTAAAAANDSSQGRSNPLSPLTMWKDQPDLHLLNLMYDVTPAEYIDMVITELGSMPPTAVSAVNGVLGGEVYNIVKTD